MLDQLLTFLERWRGLPALVGVALVILNFAAGFVPGMIIALLGLLLTEAL
jgi:hypothetical protein